MSIHAFIPVRGGSKSIPLKNIKLLAGQPLVSYAIEAALACDSISRVVVSTDSSTIREVVKQHYPNEEKLLLVDRSPETATDVASTESVMLEYAAQHNCEHIILIQATSPLLTTKDLSGGIARYLKAQAGGLVSVVRQKRFIWQDGVNTQPVNYDFTKRPRRQDFEGFLVENGAFYITSRARLLETECRISAPVVLWEMDEESYVELDEPADWWIVEQLLRQRKLHHAPKMLGSIKLFLTDVDGVLTDAGMYYGENGDEFKKFNTRDGKAFELLRNAGILTGIVTAENTELVARRAKKIKADFLYQGVADKVEVLKQILESTGFQASEVAYIGDDLNDVGILDAVGFSACPQDAIETVRNRVDKVLQAKGGAGCVREFVELIIEMQHA